MGEQVWPPLPGSVADPDDPEPDPHVLGPAGPGSRSISQRYVTGSGSLPFLINVLCGLKMPAK